MRAPTTRRRKTSRGCACLSLTARLSTLGCWSGGFCRRSTLQPPWGVAQAMPQSNPRRPRRHLVAAHASTVSPSSVVGAGRAAGIARPPTPLGALAAGSGGVRRPTVSASAPRFLARRVVAIANPSQPAPLRLIGKKNVWYHNRPGKGGFRSSSLEFGVLESHENQMKTHCTAYFTRPISGLTPFYHAEITIPLPTNTNAWHPSNGR
jgi:hypothetical protein